VAQIEEINGLHEGEAAEVEAVELLELQHLVGAARALLPEARLMQQARLQLLRRAQTWPAPHSHS
jgi:hypothetical protein